MRARGRDRVRALLSSTASALLCCALFLTGLPLWGLAAGDARETRLVGQRSSGGAPPLVLEGLEWHPTGPAGTTAVVTSEVVTFRRPELGPFHFAMGLEPELRVVELCFTSADGGRTAIRCESGRLDGERLELSGRVTASGPFGSLLAREVSWEKRAATLTVADGLAPGATRGGRMRGPTEMDLWLRPLAEARSQIENAEGERSPLEPLEEQ